MKIAAFLSHPIQHLSPLWQELARYPGVEPKVHYYSRHGVDKALDREFGLEKVWDVDLLSGYQHEFLPRCWPTTDPLDCTGKVLNVGMKRALRSGVDVAYVSGYAHLNNWIVARECRRLGIPLLYHSDSSMLSERKKSAALRSLKRPILKPFFRRVSVFLAAGDHNRAYLEYYGALPDRIRFLAIPVDTVRFRSAAFKGGNGEHWQQRAAFGLSSNDFVVGFCGKLVPRKRPLDVLDAVAQIHRSTVRVLFIGTGPMGDGLRARGGTARFAGFINQTQMPAVLSLCDVLVMPSEYDPHPLIVTEAQCLGIPVLLSDQCGCYGPNDIFRDGETGILYPCGDTARLAQALCWMIEHPEQRAEFGKRGAELAESQSMQATAKAFLSAARFSVGTQNSGRR